MCSESIREQQVTLLIIVFLQLPRRFHSLLLRRAGIRLISYKRLVLCVLNRQLIYNGAVQILDKIGTAKMLGLI